jgi:putative DNA methylase
MRGLESNALASSIILVCRPRLASATIATRRDFVNILKAELPRAVAHLQRSNIAPVDLAQSAIGPGMAVYTRFLKVLNAQGVALSVREALALINKTLDEGLAEQEGDFDADTRWALAWFEQFGFIEGEYGVAEMLSKAKNTSISALADSGILTSRSGKVRLVKPADLHAGWTPTTHARLTIWASVHHLIRLLEAEGENGAAELMSQLGNNAEAARELCYRLYAICDRRKRSREATSYNGLVLSWPEVVRLSRSARAEAPEQTDMFERL